MTSFDKALSDLGKMTTLFGNGVRIQSQNISDKTGSPGSSGIPKDITEMTKSALNSIGGEVVYIPYNPSYLNNQMLTGYSSFENKWIPDVILSGGITEYDKNIEVRSSGTDASVETAPFNVNESFVPDDIIDFGYYSSNKSERSRITLDFNMVDFQTLTGVAKVQTTNTILVQKAVADKELAFSLFGPTFGLEGSVTKVQGKHAAIRLLVQLSVIQMVGKYLALPYWKLLPDAEPDQDVVDKVVRNQIGLSDADKIRTTQVSLFFLGHDVEIDGILGDKTIEALMLYEPTFDPSINTITTSTHLKVWSLLGENLDKGLERQALLTRLIQEQQSQEVVPEYSESELPEEPASQMSQPPPPQESQAAAPAPMDDRPVRSAPPTPEEQQEIRDKASTDAMYRLLKKMSVWGGEK